MAINTRRILIFSTTYLPHIGGAELALKEITDRINSVDFDLITTQLKMDLPIKERIGNVNVSRVSKSKIFYPVAAFLKAHNLNRKNKYDAIFALQASYGGGAAWLFKLFNPKPIFILNIQEGKNLDKQKFLIRIFRKLIIKKAQVITAISKYLADYSGKINKKARIVIIPNGVDLNKFKFITHEFKKTIITASRLVEKNGVADLIEAFKILNDSSAKLVIVGDGQLAGNLKSRAQGFENISFVGTAPHEKLPEYLSSADIFVRPSFSEGLGTAFLEAMAVGLPVIGTRVGGIIDFIVDGETGLYCEVNNPEDLASKIKLLFNDESLRKKLIENGRKLVEEKYNWDKISLQYEDIYSNTSI